MNQSNISILICGKKIYIFCLTYIYICHCFLFYCTCTHDTLQHIWFWIKNLSPQASEASEWVRKIDAVWIYLACHPSVCPSPLSPPSIWKLEGWNSTYRFLSLTLRNLRTRLLNFCLGVETWGFFLLASFAWPSVRMSLPWKFEKRVADTRFILPS